MASQRFSRSMGRILGIFAFVATLASTAWATTTSVLYSFTGGNDGGYPSSDLVLDSAGNIYGTTVEGGAFGGGTVFMLTPSGVQTTLYSFMGAADGGEPYGGVTPDAQGNLYGTAVLGGSFAGPCIDSGCGVVFKLTNAGGTWKESVIYAFTGGNDGYGPGAGLSFDRNGNLYGMTPTGGAYGLGVIYQLSHDSKGNWTEKVIHTFTGAEDGATASAGRLLLDAAGNFFGVATFGGAHQAGVVFELSPLQGGKWKLKTLYSFKGQPDAGGPYGAVVFDAAGNLYGTTYYNGANGVGAVYKLTNKNGTWEESVLYSFQGGSDGSGPISNLVLDAAGSLYGTTSDGGAAGCSCGTIFKLVPGRDGKWTELVHRFTGVPEPAFSYRGMTADLSGNLYGTTVHGGLYNEGAIFKVTP